MRIPPIDVKNTPLAPSQAAQLNALIEGLTPEQTAWLLGYVTATRQLQEAPPAPAAPPGRPEAPLTVLYASQTGNAAKVAKQLAAAAARVGLPTVLVDAGQYKTAGLRNEKNMVVVASTQGEGDPPDTATELHRFLFGKRCPRLEGLRYAVLSLGDYSYANFCKTGIDLDRRFEELGAERVLARVDCDVDFEAAAASWQGQVVEVFSGLLRSSAGGVAPGTAPSTVAHSSEAEASSEPAYDKSHPFRASILEHINLNGRGSAKTTVHIEVSLTGSGISYQPGDALGVLPENPPVYRDELMAACHLANDATVVLDGKELALVDALTSVCEITTITRPFVKSYAELVGAPALSSLLDKENEQRFREYARGREIVDIVRDFPPKGLAAQSFVAMLRKLQPRLYSIASSLLAHDEEAHLLIGLTRYQSHGRQRDGVCSSFLCERTGVDTSVFVYPSQNPGFHLPSDPDARVIMIGPGTGVAPYRAFIEEREALGCRGRNWLFFGDQHFTTDFLYQVEWQRWHKSGVLSHLDLAFSRDQANKVYVQHRMLERSRDFYAWLQAGAHLYVCGDASSMAPDVHEALLAIVEKEGGKNRDAAIEYVDNLYASKRYHRDVY